MITIVSYRFSYSTISLLGLATVEAMLLKVKPSWDPWKERKEKGKKKIISVLQFVKFWFKGLKPYCRKLSVNILVIANKNQPQKFYIMK